ncbi:hypothetical protein H0H87_010294 [Tephrocybe sp. NHM501043]|nr:hypothetical protein H0H87_010294 [Tephrocybe sp. NHM501043]
MVLLVTSDNEKFTTDKDIVERSVLIKNMLEEALKRMVGERLHKMWYVDGSFTDPASQGHGWGGALLECCNYVGDQNPNWNEKPIPVCVVSLLPLKAELDSYTEKTHWYWATWSAKLKMPPNQSL